MPDRRANGGLATDVWRDTGGAIIDCAPWGVLCIKADGRIASANAAAQRILGLTLRELARCTLADSRWQTTLEGGRPCPADDHPVAVARRTGKDSRLVVAIVNQVDGAQRWIDLAAVPEMLVDAGGPPQVLATFVDLTERLAQTAGPGAGNPTASPRSSRVHQEQAVVRRTEDETRIAQRMEAVGRMAVGIAHDFNNVVGVITGYADLLEDRLGDADPLKADIIEIRKAGLRAAALTHQLLAFSRQQAVQPKVIDLHRLVSGMGEWLSRLIGEQVQLVIEPGSGAGTVLVDSSQMEQVVMNLAANARDAMPDGGRLTIATANIEIDRAHAGPDANVPPGTYVRLSVTDSGSGIDRPTLDRMFDPFFTTKQKGKGTGLGLATVQTITKQAGGHIVVNSEIGRGTAFAIYFPRARAAADMAPGAALQPVRGAVSETILVVEDDASVRSLTKRMLESAGYTVLAAADGVEAERVMRERAGSIQLLLTDVVMPAMSGRQVALRLTSLAPDLRVLYMSGYTDDSIAHHGVLEPGVAFISKPFSLVALSGKVREVLDAT